ncbi:hypothetical protein X764_16410 [Mesorhizobium sp. LSHC440A00]|nr:hypothetical protein X764_16410 [Mesorhizobium sp. LSHC440A00]
MPKSSKAAADPDSATSTVEHANATISARESVRRGALTFDICASYAGIRTT